jgi:hypothetical protein
MVKTGKYSQVLTTSLTAIAVDKLLIRTGRREMNFFLMINQQEGISKFSV